MADDLTLSEHLHKLIGVKSEQKLDNLLQLLWQTRKTGLSNSQKSSIHSLFNLPSLRDLDPVRYCSLSLSLSLCFLFFSVRLGKVVAIGPLGLNS